MTRPAAILFDMDGTLTRSSLDFDAIRAEMGVSGPLLEAMARMDAGSLELAREILDRHEISDAESADLHDGCVALLTRLGVHGIRTALITRNSTRCARRILTRHGLRFDLVITRDFEPYKPHPAPLLHACRQLGVEPARAWMVGDGPHDIEAALAAGVRAVHIRHGRDRDFDAVPDDTVEDLCDLLRRLEGLPG